MQYRKLKDLTKLENNPRLIKDKEFQDLCQSIKGNPKYFEARPLILSDRTGDLVIIAGNQRYEAAKVAKLKEVPTFLIKDITEDKEREITIRDNAHQGEWDMSILANSWSDLPLAEWGVGISADWGSDEGGGGDNIDLSESYEIVVTNLNESTQSKLLEYLMGEGYQCRALVS